MAVMVSEQTTATPTRVLIVEDDAMVRALLGDVVVMMGFEAVTAATGQQALGLLGQGDYALVITDLVMPGMGGLEVAEAVRRQRASIPVIVVSGSVRLLDESVDTRGVRLIAKPFQLHELEWAIREAVRREGA